MKKIRTWDNNGETVDLIARKKVDWSIFDFGSTIPQGFHKEFEIANKSIALNRGEKKEVLLIIAESEYSARLINIDRKDVPSDSLQIRYDQNKELKELIKSVFYSSFNILSGIRRHRKGEQLAHVPDEKAEYIEFYKTGEPFKYKLKFITNNSNTYWWVNQGQTHRSEKQGGFLWAPKQNKQGRPLKHHVDLLEAKVEDPIFTYSSGR